MNSAAPTLALVTQSPTSAAFEANGASCVRTAQVRAAMGLPETRLRISLAGLATPLPPFEATLEPIPAGGALSVDLSHFSLPLSLLTAHTERVQVDLEATLVDSQGNELARVVERIAVLPRTHWYGSAGAWDTVAAFVTPNAPVVAEFLADAARRLEQRTCNLIHPPAASHCRAPELPCVCATARSCSPALLLLRAPSSCPRPRRLQRLRRPLRPA